MKELHFEFKRDKREGLGEDANPLFIANEEKEYYAVGVFDGMGGSGAKDCESQYKGRHTQAFVASRIIREETEKYLKQNSFPKVSKEDLKVVLTERLEKEKKDYPSPPSKLRSRLVREYPTTLAVITVMKEKEMYRIRSFWAGDSRNYLWTKDGFFQISLDDLNEKNDPQENLRNDAGLANCICAGSDFVINEKDIKIAEPFVILSATDGCYGYLKTIMHFQYLLLEGLQTSSDLESWKSYIEEKLNEVTGDDMSFALVAVGFDDYSHLKSYFSNVKIDGLDKILMLEQKKSEIETSLADNKEQLDEAIQKGWNVYKATYMSKICPQSTKSAEQETQKNEDINDEQLSNDNSLEKGDNNLEGSSSKEDIWGRKSLSTDESANEVSSKEEHISSAPKEKQNDKGTEEGYGQDTVKPKIIEEDNKKEKSGGYSTLNEKNKDKDTKHEDPDLKNCAIKLKELIDSFMSSEMRDKALKFLNIIIEQ